MARNILVFNNTALLCFSYSAGSAIEGERRKGCATADWVAQRLANRKTAGHHHEDGQDPHAKAGRGDSDAVCPYFFS